MDFKSCLVLLLLALAIAVESSTVHDASWGLTHSHNDVNDMIGDDNEFSLDSEEGRRQLIEPGQRYISYDVRKKGNVPCTKNGVGYYNCGPPQMKANVYRRACTYVTRCAPPQLKKLEQDQ